MSDSLVISKLPYNIIIMMLVPPGVDWAKKQTLARQNHVGELARNLDVLVEFPLGMHRYIH